MSARPGAGDALDRWAAEQAPALVSQAKAEAVGLLRDALLTAAIQCERQHLAPVPERPHRAIESERHPSAADHARRNAVRPESPQKTEPSHSGELLWAYCVLRAGAEHPLRLTGVDGSAPVQREEAGGLVALVSRVPRAQFDAEPLRRNLNDLKWLEGVARAHEAVLDAVLAVSTIVPLRMCTIYETGEGVQRMLQEEQDSLLATLDALEGRVEWAVKVVVDGEKIVDAVRAPGEGGVPEPDLDVHGEGSTYMLRRRSERALRDAASSLAREVADLVHARLQDWALDATTRPPQNRDLSGHRGEMVLNAAYLVERVRSDELRQLVAELEDRHRELGVTIELTGPWPPYNFIPGGDPVHLR